MTYEPIANGDLVAVVTVLEMRERPSDPVPKSPLKLRRVEGPEPEAYRSLFRRIGARWLWFSRLIMDDSTLAAIIQDSDVDLYKVIDESGEEVGMLELDFRETGEAELSFVGLIPELSGHGHGRWLLAEGVRLAWRDGVKRVHVHTCTLDHPAALSAYRRAGFVPVNRSIQRFPDPRLLGILPSDCAPQVPLLGTVASAPPPAT